MYLGVDAVGVDVAGERNHNSWVSLFFISWVFIGGFVVLNVFVGVLIETFEKVELQDRFGAIFTSHQQQHWVETLETQTKVRPLRRHKRPEGMGPIVACRERLYDMVTSHTFEMLILIVIVFNTVLMAADGHGISPWLHSTLDNANDLCTAIFLVEALLKLCAHGLRDYLSEPWNVFDLLVVVVAVGEKALILLSDENALVEGSLFRIARLARAARILRTLRLIKSVRHISSLLMTLVYSIPPLVNILGVFTIVMFVYAVLGMELFSGVMWGDFLNENANFCSFPRAMLTMFRCATGEDWNGIMHDVMIGPDRGCHPEKNNCGKPWLAVPFFVSYIILTTFLVLKMLVALIIENFKLSVREDSRLVRTAHTDAYVDAWGHFDPDGVGHLPVSQLPALIRMLPAPLGLDRHNIRGHKVRDRDITSFILSLDIRAYEPKGGGKIILFHELLLALTARALEQHDKGMETSGRTERLAIEESPDSYRPVKPNYLRSDTSGSVSSNKPSESLEHVSKDEKKKKASPQKANGNGNGMADVVGETVLKARRGSSPWRVGRAMAAFAHAPAVSGISSSSPNPGSPSSPNKQARVTINVEDATLETLRHQFLHRAMVDRSHGDEEARHFFGDATEEKEGVDKEDDIEAGATPEQRAKTRSRTPSPTEGGEGVDDLVYSLQAEYAVLMIQERWRKRRDRHHKAWHHAALEAAPISALMSKMRASRAPLLCCRRRGRQLQWKFRRWSSMARSRVGDGTLMCTLC